MIPTTSTRDHAGTDLPTADVQADTIRRLHETAETAIGELAATRATNAFAFPIYVLIGVLFGIGGTLFVQAVAR